MQKGGGGFCAKLLLLVDIGKQVCFLFERVVVFKITDGVLFKSSEKRRVLDEEFKAPAINMRTLVLTKVSP